MGTRSGMILRKPYVLMEYILDSKIYGRIIVHSLDVHGEKFQQVVVPDNGLSLFSDPVQIEGLSSSNLRFKVWK
jgi:hypothetical protein